MYQIKHIIIEDISVSISAAFVKRCARENIHISFIDKLANPYAILTTHKATILNAPFDGRITYQARDIVNSSLNYAYAILYTKIRYYLIICWT